MKASRARTERPDLPARPTELSETERLKPLSARPKAGDEVSISRAVLEELYDRLNEAVGAVEKLNTRIAGNVRLWACTDAVFKTGKPARDCPQPNP